MVKFATRMTSVVVFSLLFSLSFAACSGASGVSRTIDEPLPGQQSVDAATGDDSSDTTVEQTTNETEQTTEAHDVTFANAKLFTNSIGTTWLQTIIEVENTGNCDLYMESGAYDLEDETGKLITSRKMVSCFPEVISPGEKAYYYEETTLDDVDKSTKLVVKSRPNVKIAKVENIKLPITDFELKTSELKGLQMLGRVENTSDESQNMIYIASVLFDTDTKPIGLIFTILTDDLPSNEKIGFEQSAFSLPDDVNLDAVTSHIEFAYPMQMQF